MTEQVAHGFQSKIDLEVSEFKKSISALRSQVRAFETNSERQFTYFQKLLSKRLGSKRLIYKDILSNQDFPKLENELSEEWLKKQIADTTQAILRDKESNKQVLLKVNHIDGLYDTVICRIVRKQLIWLVFLETLKCCVDIILVFGIWLTDFALPGPIKKLKNRTFRNVFYSIMFFLSPALLVFIRKREAYLKLTVRRTLEILLLQKLTHSDSYFLENSDNNMIHLLFYEKFEDYCKYKILFSAGPPVIMIICCLLFEMNRKTTFESIILFALVFLKIANDFVQEKVKQMYRTRIVETVFEHRKILYEFLNQCKSFNLKNLKERFRGISDLATGFKLKYLQRYHFNLSFQGFLTHAILSVMLFYGPVRLHYLDKFVQHDLISGKTTEFQYFRAYYAILFIYLLIEPTLQRFNISFSGYLRYRSSQQTYNKFFDNDFTFENNCDPTQSCEDGEVVFKECEVFERNKRNIKQMIDFIVRNNSKDKLKQNLTSSNSQRTGLPQDLKNVNDRESTLTTDLDSSIQILGEFSAVFTNLSAHIRRGTRVCLFENQNRHCIRGFVGMLLSENYVNAGSFCFRGSVSYFNPSKMHLLVGKTIRDNILFGSQFRPDRYDEVLRVFGVQFGNYRGHDFHQVAERGQNIRPEDLKTILFARFLYQDCDIYIIEDYFKDVSISMMKDQIESIIKHFLKTKTVFYSSDNIDMIKMSELVIKFELGRKAKVWPTKLFLKTTELSRNNSPLSDKSNSESIDTKKRIEVLRTSVKNSIFIENVNLEVELQIVKKEETHRDTLDTLKKGDVLQLLGYGITLADRKRREGHYMEQPLVVAQFSAVHCFAKLFKHKAFMVKLLLLFSLTLVSTILFTAAEALSFKVCVEFPQSRSNADSPVISNKNFFTALILVASSFGFSLLKSLVTKNFLNKVFEFTNHSLLDSIFNSSIKSMINRKSHTVLDKSSKHMIEVELQLPDIMYQLVDHISTIVVNSFVVLYSYSLLSLVPLAIVITFLAAVTRTTLPVYTKVTNFNHQVDSKIDDMNFQLLGLISGYRISGRMGDLLKKYSNISMSRIKARLVQDKGVRAVLIIAGATSYTLFMLINFVLLRLSAWGFVNFFQVSRVMLVYGSVCTIRMSYAIYNLPQIFFDLLDLRASLCSLIDFLQPQAPVKPKTEAFVKTNKVDVNGGIIFKNVSLTTGLQPILRKLSFKVQPKSRVALMGVLGSGRYNIFELITNTIERDELENSSIHIFGQRVELIDEEVIKKLVFVIERDPILFTGTIRQNLDPYDKHKTEELADILRAMGAESLLRLSESEYDYEDQGMQTHVFVQKKINCYQMPEKRRKQLLVKANSHKPPGAVGKTQDMEGRKSLLYSSPADKQQSNKSKPVQHRQSPQTLEQATDKRLEVDIHPAEASRLALLQVRPVDGDAAHQKDGEQQSQGSGFTPMSQSVSSNLRFPGKDRPPIQTRFVHQQSQAGDDHNLHNEASPLNKVEFSWKSEKLTPKLPAQQTPKSTHQHQISLGVKLEPHQSSPKNNPHQAAVHTDRHDHERAPEISFGDISDELVEEFLGTPVGFEGKNISLKSKRCMTVCRAILEKPKLLLLFEEALDFGRGIGWNLTQLSGKLPDCTMLIITKNQDNLGFFDKLIFIDGGKIIETGDPKQLVRNQQSYLHRYLREADELALHSLLERVKSIEAMAMVTDNNFQLSEESLSWRSGSKRSSPRHSPLMSPKHMASSSPLKLKPLARATSKISSPANPNTYSDQQVRNRRLPRTLDSPDKLESINEYTKPQPDLNISSSLSNANTPGYNGNPESQSKLPSVIDLDIPSLPKLTPMNPHTMTLLNVAARVTHSKNSAGGPIAQPVQFSPQIELQGDNSFGVKDAAPQSNSQASMQDQQPFNKQPDAPVGKPARDGAVASPTPKKL